MYTVLPDKAETCSQTLNSVRCLFSEDKSKFISSFTKQTFCLPALFNVGIGEVVSFRMDESNFVITEVKFSHEATVESLSPGSIDTPCFEIAGSPSNYSHLAEIGPNFSRTTHRSSGCINEIRLSSTIEIETLITRMGDVEVNDQKPEEPVCAIEVPKDVKFALEHDEVFSQPDTAGPQVSFYCIQRRLSGFL